MNTTVITACCSALVTSLIQIESGFTRGFAAMQLIGNTSDICRDGKERAKAALEAIGYFLPNKRLIVSLAPADVKKDSNHFDLPIAVSVALLLSPTGPSNDPQHWLFAAELGLTGELRPVKSVVSFAICAVRHGLQGIIVARDNIPEIKALSQFGIHEFGKLRVLGFATLEHVLDWLMNNAEDRILHEYEEDEKLNRQHKPILNFDDMVLSRAQEKAALCCATGLHSLLLRGSPGTGKSMMASRLPSILPTMPPKEHLEALQIQSSLSEKISPSLLQGCPPFRNPHHQASTTAILGGTDQPGELSLSHGGILFLDELPEFRRDLLESLREPLENGEVKVSRAEKKVSWNSRIILVAACNNCPCGWFGSSKRRCRCSTQKRISYRLRLSGPILDRIDIHFNVPESKNLAKDLLEGAKTNILGNRSQTMKEKVREAREFGYKRNQGLGIEYNRDIQSSHILKVSGLLQKDLLNLLEKYTSKTASGRALIRSIRVARSLADLDQSDFIREVDFDQAWQWQAESSAKERGEDIYDLS